MNQKGAAPKQVQLPFYTYETKTGIIKPRLLLSCFFELSDK